MIGIPAKPFKILQNSGFPQEFKSAGFGILHKLLPSFLEILKFLDTQFSVVYRGVWLFSGVADWNLFEMEHVCQFSDTLATSTDQSTTHNKLEYNGGFSIFKILFILDNTRDMAESLQSLS